MPRSNCQPTEYNTLHTASSAIKRISKPEGLVHIVRHLVATEKRRGSNNEEATPTQCLSSVNHAHYGKQGSK